jgi:AcrR family transcriptional regulator
VGAMSNDQEQKATIISAATNLFARFGLEKTTMEDIAKAAKKGKSSLYYYFKSKEQVFAEVIRYEIAGLKSAIVEAIEKEADPRNKLRKFVNTRLSYLNEKADQYITIKDEYLMHYAFIENLTVDYSNWEIATIKNILEYGQDQGLFEITDLETVSNAFFFALKGLEYPWAINLPLEKIEKSANALIDVLLNGISKR